MVNKKSICLFSFKNYIKRDIFLGDFEKLYKNINKGKNKYKRYESLIT
jgi:hypothetical protein